MFLFRFARLSKFGDRVGGEIAGRTRLLQKVVIVGAVDGTVDLVNGGESAESKEGKD